MTQAKTRLIRDGSTSMIADRYELERELARGGMGTIWIGRDKKLGRRVAVKIMAQELAQMSEALQRFEREATSAAQLRSVHVVEVYDYGVQDALPYIVMEFLEGESLGDRLKRIGRFGLRDTAMILVQICRGLRAAHGAGLVHRDLKPSNIFISLHDDLEVVKLLDFGVVKAVDTLGTSEMTATGVLLGTPQYMSPEQARGTRAVDHRSDLWSVAVIAFRMLTGVNPFQGATVGDVVLKICSDALPKISDHATDLPRDLDGFFARAFARSPEARYQSADDLCAAFTSICRQQHPDLALGGLEATGEYASPLLSSTSGMRAPNPSSPSGVVAVPPPRASGLGAGEEATSVSESITDARPSLPEAAPWVTGASPANTLPNRMAMPSSPSGPHIVVHERTPISTTVGGTPLPSMFPPRASKRRTLVLVGATAAAVTLGGVIAIVLINQGSSAPAPSSAPAASTASAAAPTSSPPAAAQPTGQLTAQVAASQAPVIHFDDIEPAPSGDVAKPTRVGSTPTARAPLKSPTTKPTEKDWWGTKK